MAINRFFHTFSCPGVEGDLLTAIPFVYAVFIRLIAAGCWWRLLLVAVELVRIACYVHSQHKRYVYRRAHV